MAIHKVTDISNHELVTVKTWFGQSDGKNEMSAYVSKSTRRYSTGYFHIDTAYVRKSDLIIIANDEMSAFGESYTVSNEDTFIYSNAFANDVPRDYVEIEGELYACLNFGFLIVEDKTPAPDWSLPITVNMADEMVRSLYNDIDDYELNDLGHVYTRENGEAVVIPTSATLFCYGHKRADTKASFQISLLIEGLPKYQYRSVAFPKSE